MALVIYTEPLLPVYLAVYGLVVSFIHLTIGLDKLGEWCPILRDPQRFQRFLVKVIHTMLWILMVMSILFNMLELLELIVKAMLVVFENPDVEEIMERQMSMVCSSYFLSWLIPHWSVAGCVYFGPHWKLLEMLPAEVATGTVGVIVPFAEQAAVQAEEGAFSAVLDGHEDAHSEFGDWEMGPFSA
nr:hypothetical protein B0A51_11710 [Rachicladosporium sp. CCFEE 5018]